MEMRCYCSYPSKPASTRSRVVLRSAPRPIHRDSISVHDLFRPWRCDFFREQRLNRQYR